MEEANDWRKSGDGQTLFTDLSKIDLSRISSSDFDGIGSSKVFNLLSPKYISNINDGMVYGNIILTLDNGNYRLPILNMANQLLKQYLS